MWDEAWDPREIVLEHGLALDELVQDQAPRRGTRRGRWASIAVHRRCSMERYHRRNSPTVEAWLHAGKVIFLGKPGSAAAEAEVRRWEHGRGRGVWWEANATHPWQQQGCCATPSSEISDGGGVAARREGDIPAEKLGCTAAAEVLQRSMMVGKECGGRLTQPTPGAAGVLCQTIDENL